MEEDEADEKMFEKQQAMFGTFNIFRSVASTIQPDREGQMWEDLREAAGAFNTPDRQNLKKLLTEYKDILIARSELMKKNQKLRNENLHLRKLLKSVM